MPKLGDLGGSVEILRRMRDQLVEKQIHTEKEEERWGALGSAADKISEACECENLEMLVAASRELKNRLRRPSIRKDLAKLESDSKDDFAKPKRADKKPKDASEKIPVNTKEPIKGMCRCSDCGKVIDGSKEPCVDEALCTACAFSQKKFKETDKTKDQNKAGKKNKEKMDQDNDDIEESFGRGKRGVLFKSNLRNKRY